MYLDTANKSDAFAPLGIPDDAIHVYRKWLPDLDGEYYFSSHWSTELILAYPQTHTVTVEKSALGGPTNIGTFKHLPPFLTLKYGFAPNDMVRPYVGAGVNITYISDVNLTVPTVGNLGLSHWSVGPAVEAGIDVALSDHWFWNIDAKWALLRANVTLDGDHISQAQLNPFLFGLGFGYRFGH